MDYDSGLSDKSSAPKEHMKVKVKDLLQQSLISPWGFSWDDW